MDALTLLKADHRTVEGLFARFEQLGERAHKSKASVVADVIKALSVHASIEEEVFYPEVRSRLADQESQVLEALEEHHIVKWTLNELANMKPTDERFDAKMTVLMESVRHHVKEEEKELFPRVRKGMGRNELAELGVALAQAKTRASKTPHPRASDTPPLNALVSSVTGPFESARDLGEAAVRKLRNAVTTR
jgi:hemerythrin superfamily protein